MTKHHIDDAIDFDTLRRYLDPYMLPSLLTDRKLIERIRKHVTEKGHSILFPKETRTGAPHYFKLRDIR
jgi:hypothetical protein